MTTQPLYEDESVRLDDDGLTIRRYYFPFANSKHIPFAQIKSFEVREMGPLSGRGRIWGSGDLRHWLPLDTKRPSKHTALVLDLGKPVLPTITPEHPERVIALLNERVRR